MQQLSSLMGFSPQMYEQIVVLLCSLPFFFFFLFCLKIPVLDSVIYDSVWIQIPLTKAQTLHENFSTHSFVFLCFFSLGYKVLSNINSN